MPNQDFFTDIITHGLSLSDELNSEKFYNHLNNLKILPECKLYCEKLSEKGWGVSVKNICARTLSYLKTKYSNPDNKNDKYDACSLLNYWVYSRLDMIYRYKNVSNVFLAFGNIQPIWYDFIDKELGNTNPNICNPIPNIVSQNDWLNRKELLGYCSDVHDLRNTTYNYPDTCNRYYEYIKRKTELYKEYERVCDSGNADKCPKFFHKCRDYNPEDVLRTLKCHSDMEEMITAASEKAITKDQENRVSPHSGADSDEGSQFQRGNPHTVTKFGNVFLGVVATTMTSGALYRFTPLGGMIRNGLGWNTNNMRNFNGGDIRLYDYASEPFNPYPGEEHYIGYHPA
ncbi:PIR protein [Plasmodium vivax]|nr:PIR protein [Plasmodium vivax]